jgi:hypothetical protein
MQFGYAPREPSAPPVEPLDQGAYSLPLWNRRPLFRHGFGPRFDLGNLDYCETANPKSDSSLAGIQPNFTFRREVKGLDL